jgi:hypothetical protein
VWHFAHEAQQERVECLVGAMNLLRRLAAEHLRTLPRIVLPTYRRDISRRLPTRTLSARVEWDAQPVSVEWLEPAAHDAPVARLTLDNEILADIVVEIGPSPVASQYPSESGVGSIVFWSTVPVDSDLRKEIYARQHLARHGQLLWRHQPDTYGLIADAYARMDATAREEEAKWAAQAQRESERLDRWRAEQSARQPAPAALEVVPALAAWAAHKKTNRPFFGYRIKERGAWVLFELADGRAGIRKLSSDPRWFADLEGEHATYEPALQLLVTSNFESGQALLRGTVEATRISTDLRDIFQLEIS